MTDKTPSQKAETLWKEWDEKLDTESFLTERTTKEVILLSREAYKASLRKSLEQEIERLKEMREARIEIRQCRWFLKLIDEVSPLTEKG